MVKKNIEKFCLKILSRYETDRSICSKNIENVLNFQLNLTMLAFLMMTVYRVINSRTRHSKQLFEKHFSLGQYFIVTITKLTYEKLRGKKTIEPINNSYYGFYCFFPLSASDHILAWNLHTTFEKCSFGRFAYVECADCRMYEIKSNRNIVFNHYSLYPQWPIDSRYVIPSNAMQSMKT